MELTNVIRNSVAAALIAAWTLTSAFVATAQGAPGWLSPASTLPVATLTTAPDRLNTAMDEKGDVFVWWIAPTGPSSTRELWFSTRAAGSAGFSTPELVSDSAVSPDSPQRGPALAVNKRGDVVVAWVTTTTPQKVKLRVRPAGGSWAAAQEPVTPSAENDNDPAVGIDDNGDVVLAVVSNDEQPFNYHQVIKAYTRAAGNDLATAPLSSETILSDTRDNGVDADGNPAGYRALSPCVAVDGTGDAIIAWNATWSASLRHMEATVRPVGAGSFATALFDTRDAITADGDEDSPAACTAGISDSGESVVAWNARVPAFGTTFYARAALRLSPSASGSFGPAVSVAASGTDQPPLLAMNGAGAALLGWVPNAGGLRSAYLAPGNATWDAPLYATTADANTPQIALDGQGNGFAAWATVTTTPRVANANRFSSGSWETEQTVSPSDTTVGDSAVSATPGGDAVAVWRRLNADGTAYLIEAGGYDASGPAFGTVDVPTSGTAGSPVQMSASATDIWSGAAAISWSFGDGATGSGGSTSHVYSSDGAFTVTVTATDGVGNTTSTTRQVAISGATTAPAITGVSPADGATGVAVTTAVSATFDKPLTSYSLVVTAGGNRPKTIRGTVSCNSPCTTVTFTPAQKLAALTTYRASASGTNAAGSSPTKTWSFTTAGRK